MPEATTKLLTEIRKDQSRLEKLTAVTPDTVMRELSDTAMCHLVSVGEQVAALEHLLEQHRAWAEEVRVALADSVDDLVARQQVVEDTVFEDESVLTHEDAEDVLGLATSSRWMADELERVHRQAGTLSPEVEDKLAEHRGLCDKCQALADEHRMPPDDPDPADPDPDGDERDDEQDEPASD